MASAVTGNYSSLFLPNRLGNHFPRRFFVNRIAALSASRSVKSAAVSSAAASPPAAVVEGAAMDSVIDELNLDGCKDILACPICYKPLMYHSDSSSLSDSPYRSKLHCKTCRKPYSGKSAHLDLTISSGSKGYGEALPASTQFFRLPIVSYLYERGWRQSFNIWGGFPGAVKEFELMKEYLEPAFGGKIIDASCGSGLFSRLFAKSGLFSLVVALDFSENMLRQCSEFIKQEDLPQDQIVLVRADISRLPFASGTVDAVHAGAALHCWPSPSSAVAEISRVLRPGGVFVATTYILDGAFSYIPLLGRIRQTVAQASGSHVFLSNEELEDLCTTCGLVDLKVTRNRMFVMISAEKPK